MVIMKILIWNVQWAVPGKPKEQKIQEIISQENPDIICITEGNIQSWDHYDHVISSQEDYGYKIHEGRRKVILISKQEWQDVDTFGGESFPGGRFVSGKTFGVDVVGVCIPWRDAHVKSGIRKPWEDHLYYLSALKEYMTKMNSQTIIMGDYNQRIPKKYSTIAVFEALTDTFSDFDIWSKGNIEPIGKQAIDHFATKNMTGEVSVRSIDNFQDRIRLSDHFGLVIEISG